MTYNPITTMYYWTKGENVPLTSNFGTKEMTCHCNYDTCKNQFVTNDLMKRLEALRAEFAHPITIDRGYTCLHHQADLVGQGYQAAAPLSSMHCRGGAVDISSGFVSALGALLPKYFSAIGTAATWFHVDTRSDKLRRWEYK